MDSMPESISLYGATVEHYAQLHFLGGPMVQSENRPGKAHLYVREQGRVASRTLPAPSRLYRL